MVLQRLFDTTKISLFIALALQMTSAYAQQSIEEDLAAPTYTTNYGAYPKSVCVFDLDNTLVSVGKPMSEAKTSIAMCVQAGFAVAFATASLETFRADAVKEFDAQLSSSPWSKYDEVSKNYIKHNYTMVENKEPYINPLYISVTGISAKGELETKGDSLNRLLRTFYGYGVGKADYTDPNNSYVKQHPAPDIKGLSGCLVLFDDTQINIDAVGAFNKKYGTNFQAVKVNLVRGVTAENVDDAFAKMDAQCSNR